MNNETCFISPSATSVRSMRFTTTSCSCNWRVRPFSHVRCAWGDRDQRPPDSLVAWNPLPSSSPGRAKRVRRVHGERRNQAASNAIYYNIALYYITLFTYICMIEYIDCSQVHWWTRQEEISLCDRNCFRCCSDYPRIAADLY